jgi:hypothetical protein
MENGDLDTRPPGQASSPDRHEAAEREVQARLGLLAARFPGMFEGDGQAIARRAIEGAVARDDRLHRVSLANGDEPVNPFVPEVGAAKGDQR